jgi:elongator complex protein 1
MLIVDHLSSRGKNLEAAQIFLDYAKDVDSAVHVLSRGGEFAEAQRVVSVNLSISLLSSARMFASPSRGYVRSSC